MPEYNAYGAARAKHDAHFTPLAAARNGSTFVLSLVKSVQYASNSTIRPTCCETDDDACCNKVSNDSWECGVRRLGKRFAGVKNWKLSARRL